MSTDKTIAIPNIGPVLIKRSNKAKRINIRIRPFGEVQLILPKRASEKEAISFLLSKEEWIQKALQKTAEKEEQLSVFDEHSTFRTRSFNLKIQAQNRENVRLKLKDGTLLVFYPSALKVSDPGVQEAIRHGIEEGLRREAKAFLPGRLSWLARQHTFQYNQVFIKNLKSRWGSCSSVNNINLNLHLMRLPDHLIDYVLLHELCHTREKNHGAHFWRALNQVCDGKARELDKAMKHYQTRIY